MACVSREKRLKFYLLDTLQEKDYKVSQIDWEESLVHKEGHPHFMIKEILEQPRIFKRAIMNRVHDQRVDFSEDNITAKDLEKFRAVSYRRLWDGLPCGYGVESSPTGTGPDGEHREYCE